MILCLYYANTYTSLYNCNATKPPAICDNTYGISSAPGNLFLATIIILTAGLKCPPDILPPITIASANAAPIAKGFPVAKIINKKNKVPTNSTKYLFTFILYN